MNKLFSTVFAVFLIFSVIAFSGCRGDDVDKERYDTVKTELEKFKKERGDTESAIEDLREEITALEIEKQKLLAEKKRLEAEVIELKIKDYKQDQPEKK